uniref:Golgi associated, gamma adaptin ear containing, ARF binding protein 1 n=1 Tax=Salarias fasciatus TaxID=181472 RepID=A0A672F5C1_SALFA
MSAVVSDKATNPLNRDTDWSSIHAFCDQLNNELEGPQLATRLLAHKIQSPQEWEAMQALLYLGSRSPEPVKKKVLELIYSWTLGLPDEAKISDAYQMLKKQGIIKQDPELPPDKLLNLPPPRPKNAIFEDEEKSKMLSRLLNSSHPEDLKAANKLIKEMVQEDQRRAEKVSKRVNAIQEVKESVSLLTQLLQDYDRSAPSQSNAELIQDLYQRCEKMRPTLFRLASDTEDNDEALAEILQANDSLTHVINLYKQQVKGEIVNGNNTSGLQKQTGGTALLDLTGLDTSPQSPPSFPEFPTPTDSLNAPSQEMGISLLDDELMSLGWCLSRVYLDEDKQQSKPTLRDLQTKSGTSITPNPIPQIPSEPPAALLNSQPGPAAAAAAAAADLLEASPAHTEPAPPEVTLSDVFVPLESIKPSSLLPVTVFDGHSLRVLFHFARDSPPSRPDVLVVIISMLSSAPVPVSGISFQTTAPKSMAVKLQPPSGTELPAFNPILPPAAVTQIMLLANPNKEKVQLEYTLTFTMGEQEHSESGSLEHFPPPEQWGSL